MNYFKKRLSLFLCMLLAFTTVCFAAPQETKAATNISFSGLGTYNTKEVQVAKGATNFYIGDYIYIYRYNNGYNKYCGYVSENSGVTYKSSNSKVASINKSTGKVDLKKTGTATITITYKNVSTKIKLKVVSKDTLKKNVKKVNSYLGQNLSTYEDSAKAFLKATGTNPKITASNRYKLLTALKNYKSADYYYHYSGYTNAYDSASSKYVYYIYSTDSGRANRIASKIDDYAAARNPFATKPSKSVAFHVTSISGTKNTNKITMKLKNKVTEDQIFGANIGFSWDTEVKKSDTYSFPVTVQNMKNKRKHYAIATVKKNSNKITIELKSQKLQKGITYKLLAYGPWLDNGVNMNTFKVKQSAKFFKGEYHYELL